jgi:hypothetical protein
MVLLTAHGPVSRFAMVMIINRDVARLRFVAWESETAMILVFHLLFLVIETCGAALLLVIEAFWMTTVLNEWELGLRSQLWILIMWSLWSLIKAYC